MNTETTKAVEATQEAVDMIEFMDHNNLNMKKIANKLNEVIRHLNNMEQRPTRDNGPKSQRKLDDDLAREILFGEDKNLTVKEACQKHGLSYGQVYSVREGYTFKKVQLEYEAWKEAQRNS